MSGKSFSTQKGFSKPKMFKKKVSTKGKSGRQVMLSRKGGKPTVHQLRGHPALELAKNLAAKETWVDVKFDDKKKDQKQVAKVIARSNEDTKLLVSMSRSLFGTKIFEIVLNLPVARSNTVTTGLFNQVISFNAALCSEWNAVSALFEEYRMTAGWMEFVYSGPAVTGVTGNASDPSGAYLQVAYDPLNASVSPGSGLALTSHEQRKAFLTQHVQQTSVSDEVPVNNKGALMKFAFKVPKGILNSTTLSGAGSWVNVAVPVPFGGIEMYHLTANAGSIQVFAGTIFMRCQFRNRY